MKEPVKSNVQPLELTVFGEGPDEIRGAKVVDRFETSSSESFLLDTGAFDDGMRMYVLAERFASGGWKWSNSFPEMDAWQLADYIDGNIRMLKDSQKEESREYGDGLRRFAEVLRQNGRDESFHGRE